MSLTMMFAITVLRVMAFFVNKPEYIAKIAAVPSMERKHDGFDLKGWEYRSFPATNGDYTHRYYYYPGAKAGSPVFLMIHGLNLDGRTWMNMTSLAPSWQLIAYDLPERCPLFTGSFNDWRRVIDDFVDQIDDSIAGVAGVSFGGGIAQHLAANHPKVKDTRLFLISTTLVNSSGDQRSQTGKLSSWVKSLPDYKIYWFMETMVKRSEKGLIEEAAGSTLGRDVRDILGIKHPDFYRQVAVSMSDFNAGEDARKVKCPVLMLIGDKDDMYKPGQEAMMRSFIPQIEYEVVPGGTHSMVYMQGEDISKRLMSYCRRTCGFTWME